MNINKWSKTGIVSYGAYVPRYRITVDEIAKAHGSDPKRINKGLGLIEKSVPGLDEDTVTISVNAAFQAQERLLEAVRIGAVYVGSESHPYAVKPTSTIVGEALNIGNNWTAADLEFACKAGTAAIQIVTGLIDANRIECGVAIGADVAQGAPGDALEYSAASGGAAFILGRENVIAQLLHTSSYTSDTPDFWRREKETYPRHGGRFTGEPAYFTHLISATRKFLREVHCAIEEFDHVVFHMPNGKFPLSAAKHLGVTEDQLKIGFLVPKIGNPYSASSLLGLAAVLDKAKPQDKILLTSYGSGSGSDSFSFEVTDKIVEYRRKTEQDIFDKSVEEQVSNGIRLGYGAYVRHLQKLIK